MSYILDALNKSEQERRDRRAPNLGTVHQGPKTASGYRKDWLAGLLILLLVNSALVFYWLTRQASPQAAPSAQPSVSQHIAPQPAPSQPASSQPATSQPPAVSRPALPASQPQVTAPEREPDAASAIGVLITPNDMRRTSSPATTPGGKAVPISDLPLPVQRQIPDLVFSSHIYSDDSSFRMVNINGRSIREGEMVNEQIRLERITEEGVILTYQDYTFEVSVLRDWSFN